MSESSSIQHNDAATTAGAEAAEYLCSCHCGATQFKIREEPITEVMGCNCSICETNGYLLTYVLGHQVERIRGWDELRNYRFASRTRDHKFCGTCGTSIGIDYQGSHPRGFALGINVRIVQGLDIGKLKVLAGNGRDFQAEYNK